MLSYHSNSLNYIAGVGHVQAPNTVHTGARRRRESSPAEDTAAVQWDSATVKEPQAELSYTSLTAPIDGVTGIRGGRSSQAAPRHWGRVSRQRAQFCTSAVGAQGARGLALSIDDFTFGAARRR